MPTKIICLASNKSGGGNTTLAMSIGGALAQEGYKTLIVDSTESQNGFRWAQAGEGKFPVEVIPIKPMDEIEFFHLIEDLKRNYDYVLVDCQRTICSLTTTRFLKVAHLVLVPVLLSMIDIHTVPGTINDINQVREENKRLKLRFIINMNHLRRMNKNLEKDLIEKVDPKLVIGTVGSRVAFIEASAFGTTVHQLDNLGIKAETAVYEINYLVSAILESFVDFDPVASGWSSDFPRGSDPSIPRVTG